MSEVTWFKVLTDIFSDDKIKILQSMPEGDSLLVMWFKVLAQAGKTNDGGYIYLKKNMPYTAGMLSTLFGKPQQLVELALRSFTEFGMIDVDEKGYIFVMNWEKHQSIDKLNQIKEKSRLRVQTYREKKKLELLECNVTETLQVTQSNAIDIDIDKEKDIYSPIVEDTKIILDHWNTKKIITHRKLTVAMKGHINARLEDLTVEEIVEAIGNYHAIISDNAMYWYSHKFTLSEFMNPKNLDRFLTENNPFENHKRNVVNFNNKPEKRPDYNDHKMKLQQQMEERNEYGDALINL